MRRRTHYPDNARTVTTQVYVADAHGVQLANALLLQSLTSSPAAQGPDGFRPGLSGDGPSRIVAWTAPLQSFIGGSGKINRPQGWPDQSGTPATSTALLAAAALNGVGKVGMA
jgi:hypothetical protein